MREKLFYIGTLLTLCFSFAAAGYDGGSMTFPVLKGNLYPGDTITGEMLTQRAAAPLGGPGSIVTDASSLTGKVARRTLLAGQPIPKSAVRDPYAVLQGKTVTLVFQSGNILITGVAVALESGSAGETITARNAKSGAVVRGMVQTDGSLRTQ